MSPIISWCKFCVLHLGQNKLSPINIFMQILCPSFSSGQIVTNQYFYANLCPSFSSEQIVNNQYFYAHLSVLHLSNTEQIDECIPVFLCVILCPSLTVSDFKLVDNARPPDVRCHFDIMTYLKSNTKKKKKINSRKTRIPFEIGLIWLFYYETSGTPIRVLYTKMWFYN